jgi:hypothetical protein
MISRARGEEINFQLIFLPEDTIKYHSYRRSKLSCIHEQCSESKTENSYSVT